MAFLENVTKFYGYFPHYHHQMFPRMFAILHASCDTDTSPAEYLSVCLAQGNWEMLHKTHSYKLGQNKVLGRLSLNNRCT